MRDARFVWMIKAAKRSPLQNKKASISWLFCGWQQWFASGSVRSHFHVMGNQGNQRILLTMGQLAEALQQLAFVQ